MVSYALAGSGTMAAVWAEALRVMPDHRLVTVRSRTRAHAERLANAYGARAVDTDDPAVEADVVLVASAPAAHRHDAGRAVRAGRAALIEAPMCATLADADVLVDAAHGGAALAYGENLLYAPLVRDAIDRARRLGPMRYLGARVHQPRPVRRSPFDADWGGGVLFEVGAHVLAVALTLAGPDRPVSIKARLEPMSPDRWAVDDVASVELVFASGATGAFDLSWRSDNAQWDLQIATDQAALRLELLPDPHLEALGVDLPRPPRRHPQLDPAQFEVFGYLAELEELGAELAEGRPPYTDVGFGRYVLDLLCAAYRSAGTGTAEPLPFRGDRSLTPLELWQSALRATA